jgi:hypothetical protein
MLGTTNSRISYKYITSVGASGILLHINGKLRMGKLKWFLTSYWTRYEAVIAYILEFVVPSIILLIDGCCYQGSYWSKGS